MIKVQNGLACTRLFKMKPSSKPSTKNFLIFGHSPGGYSLFFYTGGKCQRFISEPQILSHNFEGPQILSFKILRPYILLHILDYYFRKMSLNVTVFAIMSLFYNL